MEVRDWYMRRAEIYKANPSSKRARGIYIFHPKELKDRHPLILKTELSVQ